MINIIHRMAFFVEFKRVRGCCSDLVGEFMITATAVRNIEMVRMIGRTIEGRTSRRRYVVQNWHAGTYVIVGYTGRKEAFYPTDSGIYRPPPTLVSNLQSNGR